MCKAEMKTSSALEHIIILIPENHSSYSIYGRYCKAPTGSKPNCNEGPNCCEEAPKTLNGISPFTLTDNQNTIFDPCHSKRCEESEINGGKMDKFIVGDVGSNKFNWVVSKDTEDSTKGYFSWAKERCLIIFSSCPLR